MSNQDSTRGIDLRASRRNISAAERYEQYKSVFQAVTERWKRARQAQVVVAMNMDPNPSSRSNRMTPDDIHFCVDVEKVTERALGKRGELETGWWGLALGEPVPPKIAREVITLCGRAYVSRKLQPWNYFAPLQRGPRV